MSPPTDFRAVYAKQYAEARAKLTHEASHELGLYAVYLCGKGRRGVVERTDGENSEVHQEAQPGEARPTGLRLPTPLDGRGIVGALQDLQAVGRGVRDPSPPDVFAWLIEDAVTKLGYYGGVAWTQEHLKAVRYSRREDAERAIMGLPNGWHLIGKAVEHGWLGVRGSGVVPSAPPQISEPTIEELVSLGECAVGGYFDFVAAKSWFSNWIAGRVASLTAEQP